MEVSDGATNEAAILASAYDGDEPPPPSVGVQSLNYRPWEPDLNPTQRKIFDDPTKYILGYGEKGSGKTIGFGHKIVRHLYENNNALAIIITNTIRAGNEGIWHDMDTLILPQWKDGIGLEYTASKLDNLTKDRHRWIRNRFGGWSKIMLISVLYGSMVESRIKGPTPSYVHIEEMTNCDTIEYFKWPAGQIGRRPGIDGPQHLTASCNPEGPTHWVYKLFWEDCLDPETGDRKPDFAVYHVPITENKHRLPPGYVEGLYDIFDEVERRRLIFGEWVDRPTGEGLFADYFKADIHIKGDAMSGKGIKPMPGVSVISYDIGPMWPSVTFMQQLMLKDKLVWVVYDEIDHHGVKTLYKNIAKEVIKKMVFWSQMVKKEHAGKKLEFMHITDESAVNQWRAGGEGSYDAWEFEKEYRKAVAEFSDDESKAMRQIKMIGCPKGHGSVEARVRMLQSKLYLEELFVSALCNNSKDMLLHIVGDSDGKPKRSKYLHKFDSMTYGMFKFEMTGSRNILPSSQVAPTLIRCGSG